MEGCKNRCIYCNQNQLIGQERRESFEENFAKYLGYTNNVNAKEIEIAFFGGTFLKLSYDKQFELLTKAKELKNRGAISKIRISTTPDSVNHVSCDNIKEIVDIVELGVQSLDDRILMLVGRKYQKKDVFVAVKLLQKMGFTCGLQLMAGLPFESFMTFKQTVDTVCTLKPAFVRIYPLVIFKKTPLHAYYGIGLFTTLPYDELIKRIAYAVWMFERYNIDIIRVGLSAFTDKNNISFEYNDQDFRGHAKTFLWRALINQNLTNVKKRTDITIYCSKGDYNHIVGVKKLNLAYFKNTGTDLTVKIGENIMPGKLLIKELNTETDMSELNWSKIDLCFA